MYFDPALASRSQPIDGQRGTRRSPRHSGTAAAATARCAARSHHRLSSSHADFGGPGGAGRAASPAPCGPCAASTQGRWRGRCRPPWDCAPWTRTRAPCRCPPARTDAEHGTQVQGAGPRQVGSARFVQVPGQTGGRRAYRTRSDSLAAIRVYHGDEGVNLNVTKVYLRTSAVR